MAKKIFYSSFIAFVLLSVCVSLGTPGAAEAAYSYANSGVLIASPNQFPGLTIGPAEQYVQGSTNTLHAWVKNNTPYSKVISASKAVFRCREAIGYPYRTGVGQCQYYWNPDASNPQGSPIVIPETITLPPFGSYMLNANVTQYNSQACGSFQIDFFFDNQIWVGSFANLGQDCPNPPICTPNTQKQCVDNDVYWFDSCGNQGSRYQICNSNQTCSNGMCVNQPIACRTNSDCGTDGYVNSPYCSGNDVYQNYKTYTCNNPRTAQSYCSSSVNDQLKQDCTANQMCSNGSCIDNPTLTVSCSSSPNPANTNQTVTFTPSVSGGTGGYSYSWTGACSGFSTNCSNSYASSGTQTAFLQVTSGSATVSTSCIASVNQIQQTGSIVIQKEVFDSNNNQLSTVPQFTFVLDGNQTATNNSSGIAQFYNVSAGTHTVTEQLPGGWEQLLVTPSSGTVTVVAGQSVSVVFKNRQAVTSQNLVVSCSSSPNPANTNQTVTFTPSVSGGTGGYSYSWTGACSGFSTNCSNSYASSGTQTAFLQVTSGSATVSTSCIASVNQTQSNLSVSCYASPSSINTNQSTAFITSVNGGTGSYSYSWTGACTGSSSNCAKSFGSQGNYTANVSVTSGSQTVSASCSAYVNQQNIACYGNSDCESNSYTGSNFCSGNSIYRSYLTYTCNNAGTTSSYCSSNATSQIVQNCIVGQTCSGGVCSNTQTYSASISKTSKNLSANYGDFASYISTNPNSLLQFKIVVQAPSNQSLTNVVVTDLLPSNLIYAGSLVVDGVSYGSTNMATGISLGTISAGQSKTITYYVQVASSEKFAFGTTTLTNVANVAQQGLALGSASASIAVTRTGTLGVTNVPTGIFGSNQWQGYTALFLLIIAALTWILRASRAKVPNWIGPEN